VIIANLWLFKPVYMHVFANTKSGSALLRTTIAVTMAQGSPAPNVIPQKSSAVVNSRILPGEDKEKLLAHFRKALKGLPVEMEPIHLDNPSKLSSSDSDAYHYMEGIIGEYCPGAIIAPYLVMAGTDAKKYECVSENIFRFTPYVIDSTELGKIHGTNENISVVNINRCIDFFKALMERL
jgi:carboxypeptidase PM20D1